MLKKIADVIKKAKNVIILPHKSADGDCLGSAFALRLILEQTGKNASVILEEENPKLCGILFGTQPQALNGFDMAIAVDCGDIERLGNRREIFNSCPVTVNIDHHGTNDGFARYNYVDSNSAATGQIIYELMEFLGAVLTLEIANNLYVAISSDTGCFAYSNTTAKTHNIAAKLLETGINHSEINEELFGKNSMAKIMLMRDALNSFETYDDGKIAVVSITREQIKTSGAAEEDTGGLINLPRSLETAMVAICLKESLEDDFVKVGFRSNSVDVSEIAKSLGGGGHVRASGCNIKGSIESVKKAVLKATRKVL